jgi:hypothetical protein
LIAATALEHKLTVVTRNGADFQRSEVNTLNPFSESSTANAFPAEDALSVVRTRLQGISAAAGVPSPCAAPVSCTDRATQICTCAAAAPS